MTALEPIFQKYLALRNEADAIFAHMAEKFPKCVTCKPGCSDCCSALFDLSIVEAMFLNKMFNEAFGSGRERSDILEKAATVDRSLARLKKDMFRAEKNGASPERIITEAGTQKSRCPLLNANEECVLYESRPITCRLYGIPQAIGGKASVCGFSGFEPGENYPSVQMAKIQGRLESLSAEIGETLGSRYDLSDVYVPLSMALLTIYDDAYLGVGEPKKDD